MIRFMVFLALSVMPLWGGELKIAIMDFQKALIQHPDFIQASKTISEVHQKEMEKVKDFETEIEVKESLLQGLKGEKAKLLADEIETLKIAFTHSYEKVLEETAQMQKEESLKVYKDLQFQVERYRDREGIDLVLNKKPLASETQEGIQIDPYASVIAHSAALDITDEVIKAINVAKYLGKRIKGEEAEAPSFE